MKKIFEDSSNLDFWLIGKPKNSDLNVLLTVSNLRGERTVLINSGQIAESKAGLYVETPKERPITGLQKIIRKMTFITKLIGYLIFGGLIALSAISMTGIVKARVVLTGSMYPAIKPGDLVITTPVSRKIPKKGDVVAYSGKRFDGSTVGTFSHRIIGGDIQKGFIVKGDANPNPDVQRPKLSDIQGVVIYVIPFLGKFLSIRALFFIGPLLIGFWLLMDALKNA